MNCHWGLLLLALAAVPARAAVVVDGRLDEPAWQQAQVLSDFVVTDPYTRGRPDLATEVRVLSLPDGLYLGFRCEQPASVARVRTIGQRDQGVPGDRVNVMIDLDGRGTTAYELTVMLGGQRIDGIISRQVSYNYDWDGDWDYAVSETPDAWFVEYRIPWNLAPLEEARDGKRTIGLFVSRVVASTGQRSSQPGNAFSRSTFVADMQKLKIDAYERAQLHLFPYAAAAHDVLAGETDGRGGLDVFWKPDAQQQLAATFNPDFGQVESDQLVVNFSAIPTFFPDKRPFFTENFDLFSTDFTVLYTRRIGAAPDAGPEGATDIQGAFKYTGSAGDLQYGAIVAREDDSSQAEGRDFLVARTRYRVSDALSVGAVGTHTERPTLDRRADVGGLDFAWTPAPGVRLGGQGLLSHVDAAPTGTFQDYLEPVGHGLGGRLQFAYAPGGALESDTLVISRGELNLADAGFMPRSNEHLLQTINTWFWRDWPEAGAVQEQNLFTNLIVYYNDRGERRPGYFQARWTVNRRDTRYFGLQYQADTIGGEDDTLTQGNGNVRLPTNHRIDPYYRSAQTGLFRYYVQLGVGNSYGHDRGFHLFYLEPGLYPDDRFSITSTVEFYNYAGNLIWDAGHAALGRYDYEQQYLALNLNWFPAERHEVRAKFQWIAASGDFTGAFLPDARGHLQPSGDPIGDFSFTTTALQVRYRFELAPQSELFVVYSRAGFDALAETERHQGEALRRGLAEEVASQFLLKLRYRFSVLD